MFRRIFEKVVIFENKSKKIQFLKLSAKKVAFFENCAHCNDMKIIWPILDFYFF